MRILLVYPGHAHSTIDVASGYEEGLQSLGHEVKAYNYHSALIFYQSAIKHFSEENEWFTLLPDAYWTLASEHVVIDAVDFVPDAVLIVNGFMLHRRAYDLLHRLRIPLALLLTESPYLDGDQSVIMKKGHIAVTFTNDRNSVAPLTEQTGVRTVYLPHSFNPEIHRKREPVAEWRSDVFFHGALWPERKQLLEPLKSLPYKMQIGGQEIGATSAEELEEVMSTVISNREMACRFAATKIALNHHRTFCKADGGEKHISNGKAYSLGPRAFEIAACGAFQLCDDTRPELVDVFDGSVATYHDGDDLVKKIDYYLTHEDERQTMANDAYMRVQDCTFERRASDILIPALMEVV
jgi:spore maturation protein CgeB